MCCYLSLQEASGQLPKLKNEEVVTNACSLGAPPPPPHLGEPAGVERTQPLKEVDPDLGCGIRAPLTLPTRLAYSPHMGKTQLNRRKDKSFHHGPPATNTGPNLLLWKFFLQPVPSNYFQSQTMRSTYRSF